ncbi:MAG TPA: CehA/McbA family metallohydrolase [Terracidiphilus sp.]|jgi:predicted metal-dependent phosphoesterase TrpH
MRVWFTFLLLFCSFLSARAQEPTSIILEGDVRGSQNHTYIEAPFQVPSGVHRISVDFSYSTRDQRTTLDLGILDPYRFRGSSGGNKSHFTISETDATPSYLPGVIPSGTWKLLIAVPNIRSAVVAHYRDEIRFDNPAEDSSFTDQPLAQGTRWYRGDLHMHTAHSDGSCASQTGKRVPCPVFLTAQAAADRGLDFIAITDHNTTSHYDAMRELQPYFNKVLFIPGREITTFWGHFNVFGTTKFIDYREVAQNGRSVNDILRDATTNGAIASINHADSPTGEACMGCGWTPPGPVDMHLFTAVEVINGAMSSADFWDKQLGEGHRLTAVGGSDNHNALLPPENRSAIGHPTTAVEATDLSVPAILEGIRRGRVFVDLTSSLDKVLELDANAGNSNARMGGDLGAPAGTPIELSVHVATCSGNDVHLLLDGRESPDLAAIPITEADQTLHAKWTSDGKQHWIRAEVRDKQQKLLVLGNPVYINFPPR